MKKPQAKKKPDAEKAPAPFRFSSEVACLNESMLTDPQWVKWWKRQPSIEVHVTDLINGEGRTRVVAPIQIDARRLFADKVTGTLYDATTGRCLTANLRYMDLPIGHWDWPTAGPVKVVRKPAEVE